MSDLLSGQPIIAGSGLAGLITALRLARAAGHAARRCVLLSAAPLGNEASSVWAQGGIAAAVGADDSTDLQIADTLAAGAGLCDADAVRRIIEAGPAAIAALAAFGTDFDRAADSRLALGLEAAHSRRRIVHARGDGTGREVMRALVAAVRATPSITVLEGASLVRLLVNEGSVCGAMIRHRGRIRRIGSTHVVIATGGLGGLFLDTTNPLGSTGAGLAIAARAGAELADLEFIQFHPTALAVPDRLAAGAVPMPLVSEAVRGEGATLIDETGARFMDNELAPRDVVSRAVWHHLGGGHSVFLDARQAIGGRFATRFPGITAACRERGIDPVTMPIPIRPAAHYHMGGIAVDAEGRSTLPGLWACGEAACTGLHGANRLASNSLLEAAVCGDLVAASLTTSLTASLDGGVTASTPGAVHQPAGMPAPGPDQALGSVRQTLSRAVGVLRDETGLARAVELLAAPAETSDSALLGMMIAQAALARRESRGGHFRTDFPQTDLAGVRTRSTAAKAFGAVATISAKRRAS